MLMFAVLVSPPRHTPTPVSLPGVAMFCKILMIYVGFLNEERKVLVWISLRIRSGISMSSMKSALNLMKRSSLSLVA